MKYYHFENPNNGVEYNVMAESKECAITDVRDFIEKRAKEQSIAICRNPYALGNTDNPQKIEKGLREMMLKEFEKLNCFEYKKGQVNETFTS